MPEILGVRLAGKLPASVSAKDVIRSDVVIQRFLRSRRREADWRVIRADDGARYDVDEEIDLAALEFHIAMP
jgi:aconitate hydratase